jgi:RHS repeat-associated protein
MNPRGLHHKFTGKERDAESGLDEFGARYYASGLGRFMTPDWAARPTAVPYAVFGDPQSLNLYGYVRNDPVSRADADGHCPPGCNEGVAGSKGTADSPDNKTVSDLTSTTPAQNAAQGAAISAGASLTNDAAVRANYAQEASELSGPGASAARAALQQEAYQQLSPVGQAVTDVLKQSRAGQLAGKTAAELAESASRANAAVNVAGGAARVAGPALLVVGAGISTPAGQRGRAGGWHTSADSPTSVLEDRRQTQNGGAPLLALFEKWPPGYSSNSPEADGTFPFSSQPSVIEIH